ncbi:unnamed protein product, partial [Bubo scandiacus]
MPQTQETFSGADFALRTTGRRFHSAAPPPPPPTKPRSRPTRLGLSPGGAPRRGCAPRHRTGPSRPRGFPSGQGRWPRTRRELAGRGTAGPGPELCWDACGS